MIPILLVDDQAMIREGLRLVLQAQPDLSVAAEFADGSELLAHLGVTGAGPPPGRAERAVVLLDLVMPGTDGPATLAALAPHRAELDLAVLVLTTYGTAAEARRALALGADGFVVKDSTGTQLAAAVRSVAAGVQVVSAEVQAFRPQATQPILPPQPYATFAALTGREREVLGLLEEGRSNRVIARSLGLTERTVKAHVSHILSKLGVESRTQAALLARELRSSPEAVHSPRSG